MELTKTKGVSFDHDENGTSRLCHMDRHTRHEQGIFAEGERYSRREDEHLVGSGGGVDGCAAG
jgi:hypothetical protein